MLAAGRRHGFIDGTFSRLKNQNDGSSEGSPLLGRVTAIVARDQLHRSGGWRFAIQNILDLSFREGAWRSLIHEKGPHLGSEHIFEASIEGQRGGAIVEVVQ